MISEDEIKKIAWLAHLGLTPQELAKLPAELGPILEYVQQLQKLPLDAIDPTSHVHGSKNVFREDQVQPSMPTEEGLSNAPDTSGRFIRVPIIIEQGES